MDNTKFIILLLFALLTMNLLSNGAPRSKRSGYYRYGSGYRYPYYRGYYGYGYPYYYARFYRYPYYKYYACKHRCLNGKISSSGPVVTLYETISCEKKCLYSEMKLTLEQFKCQENCDMCPYMTDKCMLKKRNCGRSCLGKDKLSMEQYKNLKVKCNPKFVVCIRSIYTSRMKSIYTCEDEILECVDEI